MARAVLLTGPPRSGKTTVVRAVAARLGPRAGGFYTEEVRAAGQRTGFRIVTLDGHEALLASVRLPGPPRVGRYGAVLLPPMTTLYLSPCCAPSSLTATG